LGALEYLLFYSGNDNACPSYSALNKDGTWAALGADELARRKARYAVVVAADIARHAHELHTAWRPEGGGFQAAFASGAAYPSAQAALNAASNALFYVEVEVKDLKLGVPLGLSPDCTSATCPEALESRYASYSKRNIAQTLRGFGRLFAGCSATAQTSLGFDDWLTSVGAGDLSQRMLAELEGAERSLAEADSTLEQQLPSDPASVRRIYDEVKALTDILKTEFVSVLELELPQSTEGDHD
jgi:predicted lipoprotein